MATRYKMINGITTECTAEEVAELDARKTAWDNAAPARALAELRYKRDNLLKETDIFALADLTMTDDMKTYRQALRDLPSGKDTVEKCENATWPEKP
jgi:hypothetical protein